MAFPLRDIVEEFRAAKRARRTPPVQTGQTPKSNTIAAVPASAPTVNSGLAAATADASVALTTGTVALADDGPIAPIDLANTGRVPTPQVASSFLAGNGLQTAALEGLQPLNGPISIPQVSVANGEQGAVVCSAILIILVGLALAKEVLSHTPGPDLSVTQLTSRGQGFHSSGVVPLLALTSGPSSPPVTNNDSCPVRRLKYPGYSPINTSNLDAFLQRYPDKVHATLLRNGFRFGFSLGFEGSREPIDAKNLRSAKLRPSVVFDKLEKEILEGRMAGPFISPPFKNLRISPIGLVPKSDGGWRLITHLSYPRAGGSVNDGIVSQLKSVSYTKFDTVADMIFKLGRSTLMAKRDIKSAFRLLPISPKDFELLGIKFDGKIYVNLNLPFGASCAPYYFEAFSTFIHWLVKDISKIPSLDHYLDDFIFCGAHGTGNCQHLLSTFHQVCVQLGVPINDVKSTDPSTVIVFLGLEIDSSQMLIRIPRHKIAELKSLILLYITRKKITLRDLQSLAAGVEPTLAAAVT
ncbi:uncharacterized protein LOC128217487 [Mya arenaria]|uniref:uncharacterized protein LOC128217487 n=1 Tax=Mya arenaria TaxID=6604 RepID=UPI0022E3BEAB|nr:uncharacterized protein LOC128217487 [Mya arenaria]